MKELTKPNFMKRLYYTLVLFLIFTASFAQHTFERQYPYYNQAYGNIVFTNNDGYTIAGAGEKDSLVGLILIKTNLPGDTLWTRIHDVGFSSLGDIYGSFDEVGNMYFGISGENNNVVKVNSAGIIEWIKPISLSPQLVHFNNNVLWVCTQGQYIYRFDPVTGDSLWRSNSFHDQDNSRATSIAVTEDGVVSLTISDINGYTGFLNASEMYMLPLNADNLVQYTIPVPNNIIFSDSKATGNQIISVGFPDFFAQEQNIGYFARYSSDGTLHSYQEVIVPNEEGGFIKVNINNEGQVIALGHCFNNDVFNIFMRSMTIEGDSLWTSVIEPEISVFAGDLKVADDGGYVISATIDNDIHSQPYLIKTDSQGIITGTNVIAPWSNLKVYPNPAKDFITIKYDLFSKKDKPFIYIVDQSGKLVTSVSERKAQDQMIIDTRSLKPGNYYIQLIQGGKLLANSRFTIVN